MGTLVRRILGKLGMSVFISIIIKANNIRKIIKLNTFKNYNNKK